MIRSRPSKLALGIGAWAFLAFGCNGSLGDDQAMVGSAIDAGTAPADAQSSDAVPSDVGRDDGGVFADAALPGDGGVIDSDAGDTGTLDTGTVDTGTADTGTADTGVADAGAEDTGVADTGTVDAGVVGTGVVDTGVVDTGVVDTGVVDAGGPAVPAEFQVLFDMHNAERAETSSPDYVWSPTLAAAAQAYAEQCTWGHDPNRGFAGENISAGSGTSWSAGALTEGWVNEKQWYVCATDTCNAPANRSCGHYTQIIWRNSTELGCGITTCNTASPFGSGSWRFMVCRYAPPGNYTNQRPIPAGDCP